MAKQKAAQKQSVRKYLTAENGILFLAMLLPLASVYYDDANSIIRQGMNVWEALFSGHFLHYFSLCGESVQQGLMVHQANYGLVMNLILAIWNLPLYLAEKLMGGNILEHFAARLWGKGEMLLCAWICVGLLKRIAGKLGFDEKRKHLLGFLFLSSAWLVLGAVLVAQIDIICMVFILLAFEALLDENIKKFLIYFTLSVLTKEFALFVFLPIILLKEKNLIKAGVAMVLPFAVSFVMNLPFKWADPAGAALKKPRTWVMIDQLTRMRITFFGEIRIPAFFIALAAVVVVSYMTVVKEKKEEPKWMLYMGFLGMLPVFVCAYSYPYWGLLLLPFSLLLILWEREKLFLKLFLETAAILSLIVADMIEFPWIFQEVEGMLPDFLYGLQGNIPGVIEQLSEFLKQEKYFNMWTLAYAPFLVWLVDFLVRFYPGRKNAAPQTAEKDAFWTDGTEQSIRILSILRAIGTFVLCDIAWFLLLVCR